MRLNFTTFINVLALMGILLSGWDLWADKVTIIDKIVITGALAVIFLRWTIDTYEGRIA